MGWSPVGSLISFAFLCLALHISSILALLQAPFLLSLHSVVECGCLQLLYIRMYGKKLISLFQPPDFWRKDVIDRAWVMYLIPGLISCGQRDKVCFGETWQFHRNQVEQWKGLAVSTIEQTFNRCSWHSIKENIHLK